MMYKLLANISKFYSKPTDLGNEVISAPNAQFAASNFGVNFLFFSFTILEKYSCLLLEILDTFSSVAVFPF